ncbi:MAG: divalent metal cation transporter [Pseudomonadota bacterium]
MTLSSDAESRTVLQILGPGIVYAAAAVGVSHLVQATRAGATYGLGLAVVVIGACILKYPTLRFGGDYAALTGRNLVTHYRSEGWWAFGIFALSQLFSMVFIVAAIALFTLGLLQASLNFSVAPLPGVGGLLLATVVLLVTGHYRLLEKLAKYVVALFSLLIFVAVALVAVNMDWSLSLLVLPELNAGTIMFAVALIGFMPTPADGSVLQSLWNCERAADSGRLPTLREAQLDFNVGYLMRMLLGLGFLVLGTGVMYNAGVDIAKGNAAFSRQLLSLFTETIGSWSFPLIATASVFIMLSTLFTVTDGMTRVAVGILRELPPLRARFGNSSALYTVAIAILCTAAVLVLATVMESFAAFIDITSIIVFLVSPLLAWLNHRAMWSEQVPIESQPGGVLRAWSLLSVVGLVLLAIVYFAVRLGAV